MEEKKEYGCWFLGWILSILSTIGLIWSIKDKRFDDAFICIIGCLIGVDDIICSNTTVCNEMNLEKDDCDDLED